ncbi:MAG: T9SS type A sorting domain-containing protein [Ignavibacteriaceae bacterium]
MKKLCLIILMLLIPCLANLQAQVDEMMCTPSGVENIWEGQIGGYVLPAEGTINVLFIFAQFPDDNHLPSDSSWVKGQAPTNMQGWVDQTWSENPTPGSMTHYFNEMSFDKLKFIGKTVSVIAPQTRDWYLTNNKKRGDIHTEIIQQLDQTWDFAEFDNWDYEGNYNHINQPDGIVDMVFIVWRNIANEFPRTPIDSVTIVYQELIMGRYADLGWGWPDILVDKGQRRLKMDFWPDTTNKIPGGSGATLTDWFTENMFRFSIHEFGHYLQGGNGQHVGYGFWGLLSGWGIKGYVANAFERYRLGWINLNTIEASTSQTIQNATLPDFVTTGVAYRLVIDTSSNQYFYIENHQNHTNWKYPSATIEDGIYILRQNGAGGDNTFMHCIAADGRWNWTVNQRLQNPFSSIPPFLAVYKNSGINRVDGYHDLEFVPWKWNGINQAPQPIVFTEDAEGQSLLDIRHPGDGKDAFRLGYNEVWSPYSNPNSQDKNKTATPYGIKLNSLTNGVYSIDIYVNTSLNAPPSKPHLGWYHPGTGPIYQGWIYLGWGADLWDEYPIESDVNWSELQRKIGTGNWTTVYSGPSRYWSDGSITYNPNGTTPVYFRVRVRDSQNLWSLWSELFDTKMIDSEIGVEKKKLTGNSTGGESAGYAVSQNYPNPFNPSTKISYSIKEDGFVTLKVYDILGVEIATLVNEQKTAGSYEAEFNAAEFPSGIYIYKLQSGSFTDVKKMMLTK